MKASTREIGALRSNFLKLSLCGLLAGTLLVWAGPPGAQTAAAPQTGAGPRQNQLTVERIYSPPSLSGRPLRDTMWSPDGKLLSYLDDNAGKPEIWAVEVTTGQRRVLVDAQHLRDVLLPPASRGQQTGLGRSTPPRYLWAPGGQALLFISAKELFWYDLKMGSAKKLFGAGKGKRSSDEAADIDDAKISPDGRWVSFLRDHDLWLANADGGEPRQLTRGGSEELRNGELDWVYPEELDLGTAYWWAPDSSKLALLRLDERAVHKYPLVDALPYTAELTEERFPEAGSPNPVARIGVVDVGGGDVRWMDTGSDPTVLLARVAWLPDSRRLAIERLNRVQNHLELLFADANSGKCETVLTERDRYWVNLPGDGFGPAVSDDLHFFADGKRFLWSSERSGFRHLYLYDLAGRQIAQLTHGDWEVENVVKVDEQTQEIYFISTQKSPIERQLYRVALSGGEPAELTHEHGTHGVSMAPDGKHFLDTYSTAMTPPQQRLYKADGSHLATLEDNKVSELENYDLQPEEFFTVPGADGTPLGAAIIKPAGFDASRKYPVIVYLYGGPHAQVVRDVWAGSTFLWNELMAEKGFVIFMLDNRGTAGRGHKFETPVYHHFGNVELADQLAGVKWLSKQPYVDSTRVGIWGWSFGGYMTCMAMLRGSDFFKAGFAGAPVTDWRRYDTIYTERYMGTPEENPEGYRDSSPVNFASGLQGKLLIAHANGDDNVHFSNSVALEEKFVAAQKYAEFLIYADRGHGISDNAARIHIFNRAAQFFVQNLAK
ncbi:MAG: S9 family peptidase [Acidobacteria bacterium]|nr:MAG: S9 family peptidase [Acidobacteriota bacterium]